MCDGARWGGLTEREADVTVGDRLLHAEEEVGRVAGVDRSREGGSVAPPELIFTDQIYFDTFFLPKLTDL